MGRHTIGDRRGSVRGAPPDVYAGFVQTDGEDEAMEEVMATMRAGFIITLIFLIYLAITSLYTIFTEPEINPYDL